MDVGVRSAACGRFLTVAAGNDVRKWTILLPIAGRNALGLLLLFLTPVCLGQSQCGQPQVPENGHAIFQTSGPLVSGTTVSYKCDVGFILLGAEERVCQSDGVWSEHAPVCAVNVALYKPAMQSGTLRIGSTMFHANHSTDGNFDGVCSSTNGDEEDKKKPAWWRVDLLDVYRVYAVELLIPAPTNGAKELNEVTIYGGLTEDFNDKTESVCYKHKGKLEVNQLHTFVCQKELLVRYIRVVANNVGRLQLCEVVVLSSFAASEWQCGTIMSMETWGAFNGNCYYGSSEPMPWFSASTHCQMNDAGLVTEIEAAEHSYLIGNAKYRADKNTRHYWLGLVLGGNRDWAWLNGKTPKQEFWSDRKSRDVLVTNMAYAAAMAQAVEWNWVPVLQNNWHHWICQSKPKFCSAPGIPANGGLMLSTKMYTVGANAYYYCNYGYVLAGSESRSCLENGTWSDNVPKCVVIDCGKVEESHGVVLKYMNESTLAGAKVEYKCPMGQKTIGAAVRVCLPDGSWSESPPECQDIDCGMPPELTNGRVFLSENSSKMGSVAEWICDVGYGLIGTAVRHCAPNGLWMPTQSSSCYELSTTHLPLPQGTADSWHNSSLMTGFIVAVVVLLSVIIVVLIWMWRKKKLYDGLSMTTLYATSSQLASSVRPDVLYAFPNSLNVSSSLNKDENGSNYYVPSSLDPSQYDSASVHSTSGHNTTTTTATTAAMMTADARKLSVLSAGELCNVTSTPIYVSKGVPVSTAVMPQLVLTRSADNKLFLTPVQPTWRTEKLINDMHLTIPSRRNGKFRPVIYHTIRQKDCSGVGVGVGGGGGGVGGGVSGVANGLRTAKTTGAAAGRRLNAMLGKMRRKLSEANFNLLNGSGGGGSDSGNETHKSGQASLAEIVQQLNDRRLDTDRSTTAVVRDDDGRPISPSELFTFDDDDDDDVDGLGHCPVNDNVRRRPSQEATTLSTFDLGLEGRRCPIYGRSAVAICDEDDHHHHHYDEGQRSNEDNIYDLPPDASATICDNLAKTLLQQRQLAAENIYATPSELDPQRCLSDDVQDTAQTRTLQKAGIEIVHTYC